MAKTNLKLKTLFTRAILTIIKRFSRRTNFFFRSIVKMTRKQTANLLVSPNTVSKELHQSYLMISDLKRPIT